mmetsp:Transcript_119773/g.207927  ORF Transcript_119773/g.207927 Transcript_119773/m.207927 type:complete len:126 (-) Transcript_119773:114-491(-)
MNAKVSSDGSGRDTYILMSMRDFEANARGSLTSYKAQFRNTVLRDFEPPPGRRDPAKRRPQSAGSAARVRGQVARHVSRSRSGSHSVAAQPLRSGQQALCTRLALPAEIRRRQQRFSIENFLQGN